jgi:hypothetical protein
MAEPSTVKLPELPRPLSKDINNRFGQDIFTRSQLEAYATSAVLEDRRAREGVERDAARYRWLVAHASPQYLAAGAWGAAEASLAHADPDAAIDAALSSTDGGKE